MNFKYQVFSSVVHPGDNGMRQGGVIGVDNEIIVVTAPDPGGVQDPNSGVEEALSC